LSFAKFNQKFQAKIQIFAIFAEFSQNFKISNKSGVSPATFSSLEYCISCMLAKFCTNKGLYTWRGSQTRGGGKERRRGRRGDGGETGRKGGGGRRTYSVSLLNSN
jgi:hypothetical protein